MKAKPVRNQPGKGYVECSTEEATHVSLRIPGPTGLLTLPVIRGGTRSGTSCWTWNGSTEAPTLRPSVLSEGFSSITDAFFRCHSWINDGAAEFLDDCSHELACHCPCCQQGIPAPHEYHLEPRSMPGASL